MYYADRGTVAGVTYGYRIVSYTAGDAESPPSDTSFTRHPPLPAPGMTVTASHYSVTLECAPPKLPDGYAVTGCPVYRSRGDEPSPLVPYAVIPVAGRYEDTLLEPGSTYRYAVTVEAKVDGQTVESLPATLTSGLLLPD